MRWKDLDRTDLKAARRLEAPFKYTKDDIQDAVKNSYWQQIRVSMKGTTTRQKLGELTRYLASNNTDHAYIRVDNYLNALRRGGQLPPKGWDNE